MPQAAQHHGQQKVDVTPRRPLAIPAQRHIQIIAQKARQRHVPAAPKVDDAGSLVRRGKVKRQAHAHHARQPDGHIGVTRKIKVELKGIGQRTTPSIYCTERHTLPCRIKHRARIFGHAIGNQHFLGESDKKYRQANREVFPLKAIRLGARKLRHHLLVMQHRPRNEMRKISDEQTVVDKARLGGLALIHIHQKGNLREREK